MSDNLVKWLRSAGVPGMDESADRIEKLEANIKLQLEWYLSNKRVLDDRIEKLEAALRRLIDYGMVSFKDLERARKALEGKDE